MKIAFINPPWWQEQPDGSVRCGVRAGSRWPFTQPTRSLPDQFRFGDYTPYPFFLGFACSYAEKHLKGWEVRFRDSIALKEGYTKFIEWMNEERPDYVVMESWTSCWDHDVEVIKGIARYWPDTKIMVVGPICISKSKEILETLPVVAVARGEYEKAAVRFANGATGDLGWNLMSEVEMNDSPPPYMDTIHAYKYSDACPLGVKFPHMQVWSSRGCVFKCEFCITPGSMTSNDPDGQGVRKMRYYSEEYLVRWLEDWKQRFDFQSVYFDDDTMNMGNKHTEKVCAVMRRIGLPWAAMCRADTIKRETWLNMKQSGCYGVKIGFESGSQYVVDKIVRKGLDLKEAAETTRYLRSIGLHVHGTFTYGHPGETAEQRRLTYEYRRSLPLTSFQESGVAEMDGSPLAEIRKGGASKGYEGVNLSDEGYTREVDGMKKVETIIQSLQ